MALRVPSDLKATLDAYAAREGKSLNQTCVDALARVEGYAPSPEALTGWIAEFFADLGGATYTDNDMARFLIERMAG